MAERWSGSYPSQQPLTTAQLRVLRLYVTGLSYAAVGEALWISPWTVRGHVKAARAAAGVHGRAALTAWARERGLV